MRVKHKERQTTSLFDAEEVSPKKHEKAEREPIEVDDLTLRLQNIFASDALLRSIILVGELRESKLHTSGHFYFSLLGQNSRISCALFKQNARGMGWVKDGDKVLVEGSVDIYQARGTYQLYARKIVPLGEGAMERARQETQAKLQAEGLFSEALKRLLPRYPEKVAVVTSQTGAAVQDVIKVASTRWPICEIVVVPTLVQGIDAPQEIIKALHKAAFVGAECVMLVRGGGGREDLVPFDDADVVRAVRSCPLPVVTGLGHQQDTTLCDLASDFAAPTPSAAAEKLFPDAEAVLNGLDSLSFRLEDAVSLRVERLGNYLTERGRGMASSVSLKFHNAESAISKSQLVLSSRGEKIVSNSQYLLASRAAALDALSPLSVLARGFVTCEAEAAIISSIEQICEQQDVSLNFVDGRAEAKILRKTEKAKKIR